MKSFTSKLILFISPVVCLALFKAVVFEKSGGDLTRIGVLSVNADYRSIFIRDFNQKKKYFNFSEKNQAEDSTIKVLLIGDSFSRQKNYGYRNLLANHPSISVIYFDLLKEDDNPISILNQLSNGDFFDHNSFDFVILGSVERSATQRARFEMAHDTLLMKEISLRVEAKTNKVTTQNRDLKKELKEYYTSLILFYQYRLLYLFDDNAFNSEVYQFHSSDSLFSYDNKILIYDEDILNAKQNSDHKLIAHLNAQLNILSQQLMQNGTELIFVPAADKYDFYFDEIITRDKYAKPQFFETLEPLDKYYHYLDSKALLAPLLAQGVRNIYFYDDTHWSPIAAKEVAKELSSIITAGQ